jgi:hypothetical protein
MTEPTTTEIAFHDVTHLQAAAYDTKGAPLVLRIDTSFGKAEIILYLDEQPLAEQLAGTINDAWERHLRSTPPAAETAAYAAMHYAYNGGGQ